MSRTNVGQFNKPAVPPLKTPPPTLMGAPMDLSSSLPKFTADLLKSSSSLSSGGAIDLSEVQDFSITKKSTSSSSSAANLNAALSSAFPSMGGKGGKLDDTLNKLMKKNNCNIEEPVVGKEKKRKKLDEIVLGLSAAKEQKTFPDPSLPSSKKPQIPPSVSVTPANMASAANQNQQTQKPFTITVTTVPGKSSKNSSASSSTAASTSNSGLNALQNLSVGGLTAKDSLSAFLAQTMSTDPATFIKQQQKMMQCLPPAQRKLYENMLTEMGQVMKMSAKYDTKVNKWLTDSTLNEQIANMDYGNNTTSSTSGSNNSRRSSRQHSSSSSSVQQQQQQPQQSATSSSSSSQLSKSASQQQQMHHQQQQHHHQQQQQQQQQSLGPQGLTGEEPVPVINKQTGKRLSGSKAPVLKRLMQWLTENPNYEVDPKWLEQMQSPMTVPSPKPSNNSNNNMQDYGSGQSSKQSPHGGRPSSTSSNASNSSHSQLQQQQQQQQMMQQQQQQNNTQSSSNSSSNTNTKKSSRQSAIDQANAAIQFGSLAGLNPSLLASLPGLSFDPKNPLGAFDPKNPLLSMPFAGMPGMNNIPGLSNLNNMNLFASLAGMGNLSNLAGMDANSLATLMAVAGPALSGLGGSTSSSVGGGSGKNSGQGSSSTSSKKSKNDAAAAQTAALNAALSGSLGTGVSSNTGGSSSTSSSSNNKNNAAAAASASQLAAGFPFLFPNPSLLYPPMGIGGLNPYSMGSTGLGAAYDQLAQQYNLLNGGATSSSTAGTTQSKSHQSQSKSSNSRSSSNSQASAAAAAANLMNAMAVAGIQGSGSGNSGVSNNQSSSRSSSRQSAASRAAAQASAEMAQLSNLLMSGADPQLLESISRMTGIDLAQASRLMNSLGMSSSNNSGSDKRTASNQAAAAAAAQAAQEKQAVKEQQKWMESLARGALPTDLLTLQAFSQGKMPSSSNSNNNNNNNNNSNTAQSSNSSNNASGSLSSSSKSASKAAAAAAAAHMQSLPGMSNDLSQAFLAEMAAQAMAAAGGQLPLTGPGSLASLTGNLAGMSTPTSNSSSSNSSSKRQREQEAFKQQMDYYTKTLGLGSGISLIPTSSANVSSNSASASNYADDHHKSKRSRSDMQQLNTKDELTAAALAAGLPINFGSGGMTSIEKNLRSSNSGTQEADKVTLTPLNSAGITANLPSQTTITIAPPITSSASSSSERSERNNESRISLTITNAADAAKLPPPYEEADELIIQPILKKQASGNNNSGVSVGATSSSHSGSLEDLDSTTGDDNRRSSSRLKRPRSGADHTMHAEQPPEKRRELRSTRHTRQSSNMDATLNLSGNSDAEEKHE